MWILVICDFYASDIAWILSKYIRNKGVLVIFMDVRIGYMMYGLFFNCKTKERLRN